MTTVMTDYGLYRPLSDRLPDFLETYPPSDGYGVEIVVKDLLAVKPALTSLYQSAIQAGRSFKSAGLPPLPNASGVIIVAYIVRNGERLASAQTYQSIDYEKDLEIAETRARQRLVAALGFDGASLNEDEPFDAVKSVPIQHSEQPADEPSIDTSPSSDDLDVSVDVIPGNEELEVVPSGTSTPTPSVDTGALTPQLQNQVNMKIQQYHDAGLSVSMPTTKREALNLIRDPVPNDEDKENVA